MGGVNNIFGCRWRVGQGNENEDVLLFPQKEEYKHIFKTRYIIYLFLLY